MELKLRFPTPYHEVNMILLQLRTQVRKILDEQFTGMYLYGSLALGDFNPFKSDIDFLVVTKDEIDEETPQLLKAMHIGIATGSSKWAMELEGSYIPKRALRRYDPGQSHHPHIDRGSGELAVEQHDSDWVVKRFNLREHGVVLAGPDPKTLIDPISSAELRQAALGYLWWWQLQLENSHRVAQSNYQAYAVLTMCRILFTLEHAI